MVKSTIWIGIIARIEFLSASQSYVLFSKRNVLDFFFYFVSPKTVLFAWFLFFFYSKIVSLIFSTESRWLCPKLAIKLNIEWFSLGIICDPRKRIVHTKYALRQKRFVLFLFFDWISIMNECVDMDSQISVQSYMCCRDEEESVLGLVGKVKQLLEPHYRFSISTPFPSPSHSLSLFF